MQEETGGLSGKAGVRAQSWEPGCGDFGYIRMGDTVQAAVQSVGHVKEAYAQLTESKPEIQAQLAEK